MPRRFVDLSIYLENDVISDPPPFGPKIQYHRHEETAGQIAGFFPGLKKEDLPDGQGWAVENVNLSTHNGTHLDAPYHFHPTMNKGERAITIDEVPLEWCFQPGVKLDFRDKPDGHVITAREVEAELKRIGHELKPLEIVVVNTRAGSRYGNNDYVNAGCGMGYDATIYLLEKGIRLTGTDAWSWDAPFYFTAQKWAKDHDPSIIWEGHKAGRDIGYCHLEKLHNLEALPGDGFWISCFPHKIKGEEEYLRFSIETGRKIVESTKGLPVRFGVENHGTTTNRPEFTRKMLDGIGSKRFGLTPGVRGRANYCVSVTGATPSSRAPAIQTELIVRVFRMS